MFRNVFQKLKSTTRSGANAKTQENAKIEETSQLLLLPQEIILLIADNLPAPSAACLALCNHRSYHILEPKFIKTLQNSTPNILLPFLSSLAKDLPRHFVCQQCIRLHLISAIKWPRTALGPSSPRCTNWGADHIAHVRYSPYRIYYPHYYLAMQQHHSGSSSTEEKSKFFPLEALNHLEVSHDQHREKTTLLSVDMQNIENELLMRSQIWTLLPWSRRDEFTQRLLDYSFSFYICEHGQGRPLYRNLVPDLVKSRLEQLDEDSSKECGTSTQIMKCPNCHTDYTLDIRAFGPKGFALLLTKWSNLGSGLSPTDPKWRCHISSFPLKGVHEAYYPGEIRACFESTAAQPSVENLTIENERRLFSKREKRVRCCGEDGITWIWDRDDRWYIQPSGPLADEGMLSDDMKGLLVCLFLVLILIFLICISCQDPAIARRIECKC